MHVADRHREPSDSRFEACSTHVRATIPTPHSSVWIEQSAVSSKLEGRTRRVARSNRAGETILIYQCRV